MSKYPDEKYTRYTAGFPFLRQFSMTVRAKRILAKMGIDTMEKLCALTTEQLKEQRGCGEKTIAEIMSRVDWFNQL